MHVAYDDVGKANAVVRRAACGVCRVSCVDRAVSLPVARNRPPRVTRHRRISHSGVREEARRVSHNVYETYVYVCILSRGSRIKKMHGEYLWVQDSISMMGSISDRDVQGFSFSFSFRRCAMC